MSGLLFLSHRIPYPPNKGDKIRSYHLLKYLAGRYDIYLGTFVDDMDDWRYREDVEKYCRDSYFAALDPRWARLRSIKGLFSGEALTVEYYANEGLRKWVKKTLDGGHIQRVLVFSSAMAQYVDGRSDEGLRTVVDFVDIDSDKWAQYSGSRAWPESWLYRHEARVLSRYEREVAERFNVSIFVSEAEAELFKQRVPNADDRITYINNGVDTDYYSPERTYADPFSPGQKAVVFTGAMDYWPNVDAVAWFAREIFPEVRHKHPDAWFYIVGARPNQVVTALGDLPNIKVTGTVDDVRPYLAHARLAVAPLRVARGIQNKVLEAMSMAKPVVATTMALEGIVEYAGPYCADNVGDFSAHVAKLLDDDVTAAPSVSVNRDCVLQHYNWDVNLSRLFGLIEGGLNKRRVA